MITKSPIHRNRRRGYTLLEIMFSILILGVGMAAVASLFPFAAHIQQNTMHDLLAQQTKTNIVTLLHGKGIRQADVLNAAKHEIPTGSTHATNTTRFLIGGDPFDLPNYDNADRVDPTVGELNQIWPAEDRSYPTTIADPEDRVIFWEPLFIRSGNEWRIMVVIMRKHGKVVPVLANTALNKMAAGVVDDVQYEANHWLRGTSLQLNRLKVGQQVVDQFGTIYDVIEKTYDSTTNEGQDATAYAVKVEPALPAATTAFTFWHVSSNVIGTTNNVQHHGEILDIVTLGNEVLK